MANVTGLAAARHACSRRRAGTSRRDGLSGAPPLAGARRRGAPRDLDRALRLLGLGSARVGGRRRRPGPDARRRAAGALAAATAPTIVCAQAGNVNTGAFDPLGAIADVARTRAGAWAARRRRLRAVGGGQPARAAPRRRGRARRLVGHRRAQVAERPVRLGHRLLRDTGAHRAAMARAGRLPAPAGGGARPVDWAPEFSRRARGFAVYAALRSLGRARASRSWSTLLRTRAGSPRGSARAGRRVLNEVVLNQVLVRFEDDHHPAASRTCNSGDVWMSGTTWGGQAAMRISVSNWQSDDGDADLVVDRVSPRNRSGCSGASAVVTARSGEGRCRGRGLEPACPVRDTSFYRDRERSVVVVGEIASSRSLCGWLGAPVATARNVDSDRKSACRSVGTSNTLKMPRRSPRPGTKRRGVTRSGRYRGDRPSRPPAPPSARLNSHNSTGRCSSSTCGIPANTESSWPSTSILTNAGSRSRADDSTSTVVTSTGIDSPSTANRPGCSDDHDGSGLAGT